MSIKMWSGFLLGMELFISTLLNIFLVLPVFTLIFGVNSIRRWIFGLRLKWRFGNKAKLAVGVECTWRPCQIVRGLGVFDRTGFDWGSFKPRFIEEIGNNEKYKSLCWRLNMDDGPYKYWQFCDNYDPLDHFRVVKGSRTEDGFMAQILEFGTRFPAEKPQWEIILLEELPNPHQVGVVFRFHHSYGDGLSFIGALLGMTKEDEFPLVASPFVDHLSGWGRFKLNAFGCAMFGLTLVREMFFVPPPCPRYRHEDGGEGYSTLRFNIPLSKLRTITKRTEQPITISSIMMTSIAAAVARLPTTQAEPFYLKGALVVTNPPYPRGKLCHRFSTLLVSLPQDAHNVTEKTLVEISKSCRSSFNPTAFFTRFLGDYLIGSLPTKICENNPVTNYLVLSNIPFLKKRNVKFAGSTLLDCAAFFHVPNALYVSMISMEDNITVTMTAARTMLNREELDAVAVMLVQQIDSLTSMKSRLPLRKDFEV